MQRLWNFCCSVMASFDDIMTVGDGGEEESQTDGTDSESEPVFLAEEVFSALEETD